MLILIEFNPEPHLEGLKGELAPMQGHLPSVVRASYCKPLFFATQEMLNLQTQPWYQCRCQV